ncbi:hypothetical protein D3C71_1624120 [compost metagenome]
MTGVNANNRPCPNKMAGSQIEVPTATAAISVALYAPAIMVSTTPIAVCDICAMITGIARANKLRASMKYFCTHTPFLFIYDGGEGRRERTTIKNSGILSKRLYPLGKVKQML